MAGTKNDVFTRLRVSTKDGTEVAYPFAPLHTETNSTAEPDRPFFVSSDDFVKRALPIAEEHLRRLNWTPLRDESAGGGNQPVNGNNQSGDRVFQPVNPDDVRLRPNAAVFQGENYTAQVVTVNGRPYFVVQHQDGQLSGMPVEDFLDLRLWFNPHLVRPYLARKYAQAAGTQGAQAAGTQNPNPAGASPAPPNGSDQSQQRPMNIFEYMEKLPPQERMVFTILLYLLISETMGRIFQRSGGNRQSPPIAWQTPWMPGPPKGQQWMIWG